MACGHRSESGTIIRWLSLSNCTWRSPGSAVRSEQRSEHTASQNCRRTARGQTNAAGGYSSIASPSR
eukprot:6800382-Prymnesium_polylepis.2